METTMLQPPLNDAQLFVLRTFATAKSEEEKEELISFYLDYIQKKLDVAANQFWDSENMNNARMEELMHAHYRSSKK